jgi:hypothetical protein
MPEETTPAPEPPKPTTPSSTPAPVVDKVPVDLFIKDASQNVSVQGMLADKPELRTAILSYDEWEAALTAYNKTEIR